MDYAVIFDISREPFRWLPLWCGLAIAIVPFFIAKPDQKAAAFGSGCVTVVAVSAFFAFQFVSYRRLVSDYHAGRYLTVEGCVSDYRASPPGSHKGDTFVLAGRQFHVWPPIGTPAYHTPVSEGGRNLSGLHVKLKYAERDQIIWLGVSGASCT